MEKWNQIKWRTNNNFSITRAAVQERRKFNYLPAIKVGFAFGIIFIGASHLELVALSRHLYSINRRVPSHAAPAA
jgi:hypothetical protein